MGDLSKVKHYQKKAQQLNKKLEETGDKIDGFNREEDAFDWDRTQYPKRIQGLSTLAPYLKLYDAIVEFDTKYQWVARPFVVVLSEQVQVKQTLWCVHMCVYCSVWMNGPFLDIDPDKVDADVGNLWRTLYKSEKTFNEVPNAQKMAEKVSKCDASAATGKLWMGCSYLLNVLIRLFVAVLIVGKEKSRWFQGAPSIGGCSV